MISLEEVVSSRGVEWLDEEDEREDERRKRERQIQQGQSQGGTNTGEGTGAGTGAGGTGAGGTGAGEKEVKEDKDKVVSAKVSLGNVGWSEVKGQQHLHKLTTFLSLHSAPHPLPRSLRRGTSPAGTFSCPSLTPPTT